MATTTARVHLWGRYLGAVTWLDERGLAAFEYTDDFARRGLEVAPLTMPVQPGVVYQFPQLDPGTFRGLPGLLADVLPDKFGNAVIDAWLARAGRDVDSFNPVERLCYVGRRGMGALEFEPAVDGDVEASVALEIDELVALAQEVTELRKGMRATLTPSTQTTDAILDIMRVGTSAGGARPKAVIAMNDEGQVRSGQVAAPPGYDYWLLKFDGVDDLELGAPGGYGRIEYAYHRMAVRAGITMSECRLLEEGGRAHFLTKRFDRTLGGGKLHMLSLCGLRHYDFNLAGAYSYEQAFAAMRELRLPKAAANEQFRRMVFNVVARNQDDHTKNIAFLMDEKGTWSLSPAFDVTFAHNPAGRWTSQHQMSIAGKRDGFTRADLLALGQSLSLPDAGSVIDEVTTAVRRWPEHAAEAGVPEERAAAIASQHRLAGC